MSGQMRTIQVIGIGAGDPDQLTLQAVEAIGRVDVTFILDKGGHAEDLARTRHEILSRYAVRPGHRVVEVVDPERDRVSPGYIAAVDDWRRRRADLIEA